MESEGEERRIEVTLKTTFSAQHNKSVHIAANLRCDDDTHVELSVHYEDEHVSCVNQFIREVRLDIVPSTTVEITYVEQCF